MNAYRSLRYLLVLICAALLLTACGGGGSGSTMPAPPTEQPPGSGIDPTLDDMDPPAATTQPLPLPDNHGLAVGRYTVEPGTSEVHGNIVLTCPAGGGACVIDVEADGSAAYTRTGGAPTVIFSMSEELPTLPLQRPRHAAQAPIVDPLVEPDGNLHVGAGVAPHGNDLTAIETHSGVAISAGRAQDGEAGQRVLDFLEVHIATQHPQRAMSTRLSGAYRVFHPLRSRPPFAWRKERATNMPRMPSAPCSSSIPLCPTASAS